MRMRPKVSLAIGLSALTIAAGVTILNRNAPANTAQILRLTNFVSGSVTSDISADALAAWKRSSNNIVLVEFTNNERAPLKLRPMVSLQAGSSSETYWAEGPIRVSQPAYLLNAPTALGAILPAKARTTVAVAVFETPGKTLAPPI